MDSISISIEKAQDRYSKQGKRLIESRRHFTFNDPDYPGGRFVANEFFGHPVPGDIRVFDAAAPGIGRTTYRVTDVDEFGSWGVVVRSTVRELTAAEVR